MSRVRRRGGKRAGSQEHRGERKRAELRPARRLRRDPEQARAHILAAAQRVFASRGPDAVGLKDVAREAGVSHGLVTHYFGTYDALVEAALEDHAERARSHILTLLARAELGDARSVIDAFFDVVEQPGYGRLLSWALLSGRAASESFFARRILGPKQVADAIELRLRERLPDRAVDRDEIEFLLLLVMAAGFGYALGGGMLWTAMGRTPTKERAGDFRRRLAELLRGRLALASS